MTGALRDRPQPEFEPPEGIVEVRDRPETGRLAGAAEKGVVEPFKEGTEPKEAEAGAPPSRSRSRTSSCSSLELQ